MTNDKTPPFRLNRYEKTFLIQNVSNVKYGIRIITKRLNSISEPREGICSKRLSIEEEV